jgi:glucose/arabinose dehydrogenase
MSRPRATVLLALATACTLSACAGSSPDAGPTSRPAPEPTASAPTGALEPGPPEVLVTGLEAPWGLAFLPGGDALVSERDTTRVLRVPAGGGEPTELTRLGQARPRGEGGLLGLAVEPDGELVYAYLTAEQDNRIVRFPLARPDEVEPVLTGIPKGIVHNGGRIAFGPDGHLYAGTGDTGDPSLSQDPSSLGGKVLRMTADGQPVSGASSLVFSRGHRNVQGLAFDDEGAVYAVEFGQNRFDEVNRVSQGTNGGWPEVEGPGDGGGRFLAPITTWEPAEASPSGAAIAGDALYVAALRGQRLWQVPLTDPGRPRALLEGEFGRLRTAERAPDGSLWVLTSNRDGRGQPVREDDRILRLPLR